MSLHFKVMMSAPLNKFQFATCSAPTNIATIKYWGKEDVHLNTPLNSSVSVTLDPRDLNAKTTVCSSSSFHSTRFWLNGKEDKNINKRVQKVIEEMKKIAKDPTKWQNAHFHIVSENSFPTAAGLASSAAGYACLVACFAELFDVKEQFDGHLSTIARQGSGSACRSLYGGFVRWQKSNETFSNQSYAVQVADEFHWKELCAIICVVNDQEKETSSTNGMQTSKDTSTLLRFRVEKIVNERLQAIEKAYLAKDFATFGRLTMKDSNQFHAICLDTYPPIFYLNEVSKKIIHLVHQYNHISGNVQAAYTFDAGPNAVIFTQEQHVEEIIALLKRFFPRTNGLSIHTSLQLNKHTKISSVLEKNVKLPTTKNGIKMLYVTRVGGGTRLLGRKECLIDLDTGLPNKTYLLRHKSTSSRSPDNLTLAVSIVGALIVGSILFISSRRNN
jgi:diphosphomevalonate decarboxylase